MIEEHVKPELFAQAAFGIVRAHGPFTEDDLFFVRKRILREIRRAYYVAEDVDCLFRRLGKYVDVIDGVTQEV